MWTLTSSRPPATAPTLLPAGLRPMLAQSAGVEVLRRPEYAFEVKWDGMRVLAGWETAGGMALRSRNGLDATTRFPELAVLPEALGLGSGVLDGEIVRFVDGRPSFWALQRRIQASNPREIARLAEEEPVQLLVFDLLQGDGASLLTTPWAERRAALDDLLAPHPFVRPSPVWSEGVALWHSVYELDLEGVIAKRRTSRYLPGKRSPDWLKIKIGQTRDVVVGGWTEGQGGRSGTLGALLVGQPGPDGLHYLGHVGTGFTAAELQASLALLSALETATCPFQQRPTPNAPVHWVRPEAVAEITHQGWSGEGRLRAPVFVRWRPDKAPEECMESS